MGEQYQSEIDSRVLQSTGDVTPLDAYVEIKTNKLYWKIDKVNQEIIFYLETDLSGWFGFGFSKGMEDVDMAIIQCYSGNVIQEMDYYSFDEDTPAKDTQ